MLAGQPVQSCGLIVTLRSSPCISAALLCQLHSADASSRPSTECDASATQELVEIQTRVSCMQDSSTIPRAFSLPNTSSKLPPSMFGHRCNACCSCCSCCSSQRLICSAYEGAEIEDEPIERTRWWRGFGLDRSLLGFICRELSSSKNPRIRGAHAEHASSFH